MSDTRHVQPSPEQGGSAAVRAPRRPVRAVLFDLDGTLADTAPDLARILNRMRREAALAPLPYGQIRPHVSHGTQALIRHGFGIEEGDPRFASLRERILELYQEEPCRDTALFPGMAEVLERLERRAIPWGVVTNKPARFTDPLMRALGLERRARCIVSGDTTPFSKPHPAPMLHACREVACDPKEALFVGDAQRDIEAGAGVGMTTLVALFGYLGERDRPLEWCADGMISTPEEILEWVGPEGGAP